MRKHRYGFGWLNDYRWCHGIYQNDNQKNDTVKNDTHRNDTQQNASQKNDTYRINTPQNSAQQNDVKLKDTQQNGMNYHAVNCLSDECQFAECCGTLADQKVFNKRKTAFDRKSFST